VGLAGEETSDETLGRLLPTIKYDIVFESDRMRDANFPNHLKLREISSPEENSVPLSEFLSVSPEVARSLAQTPYLFVD
jgi:hypothetical protein